MTPKLTTAKIRGVLLDIEGTTTPISFVHEVLFSYARAALRDYLTAHWNSPEIVAELAKLGDEHVADVQQRLDPPPLVKGTEADAIASTVAYLNWLMDRDRKSTVLKSMQGQIWKKGYLDGTLKAELFDDVPGALTRWRNAGLSINIFSSGSELAQKLLFAHTKSGDFTGFIDNYFDTSIGAKTDVGSYRRIADRLSLPAPSIVFISDVVLELEAAREAGMQTLLCVRPGNLPNTAGERFQVMNSFEGLVLASHEN